MKALLTLCALALIAPLATAAPPGATVVLEKSELMQASDRIDARDSVDFDVGSPSTYQGNATWELWVPSAASAKPTAALVHNGTQTAVDPARVNMTGTSGSFDRYAVSLTGLGGTIRAGDRFTLVLTYAVPGTEYRHHVVSTAPVTVDVRTLAGYQAISTDVSLSRIEDQRYHGGLQRAAAGTEYTVRVVASGPVTGSPLDLNPYLYFLLGLIVGIFAIVYANRRGWTGAARAKKYEKGGEMESRELLEARRRTLMAALKELEVAHEAKEIPDAAYAPLKEEYKAQAVRVLRTLEQKEPGAGGKS